MAHRRRQGLTKDTTFTDLAAPPPREQYKTTSLPSLAVAGGEEETPSLAVRAIGASSANSDYSLSSAYGESAHSPSPRGSKSNPLRSSNLKDSRGYGYTSMKNLDSSENKRGFWGVLARKAKSIVDDQKFETPERRRMQMSDTEAQVQYRKEYKSVGNHRKTDNPKFQKGLNAITSSMNYIGGTIGKTLEEGFTIVENRTADIIHETRKLQMGKTVRTYEAQNRTSDVEDTRQPPQIQTHSQLQMQTDLETRLKASRDVAMAMAAKAKLLLRELKTVKADLAFAKERCAQLEEENRILRESSGDTHNPENDEMIRLQLETLLAEKARLAQENSVYARENRFLREIIEYHQLTMQDVVYLDEASEEVTEVYPIRVPSTNNLQSLT